MTGATVAVLDGHQHELAELVPLLRRVVDLDPTTLARIRIGSDRLTVLVRLPFGVLAGRALGRSGSAVPVGRIDTAGEVGELLAWLDTDGPPPVPRDEWWRGALPPQSGWRRIETVPDRVVRDLVGAGSRALRLAAEREGVPGAQPRAQVTDALLDSVVLTVSGETVPVTTVPVRLRELSALLRMGFLPPGSHVAVDVAGRWSRIAGAYGSVYAERAATGIASGGGGLLTVLPPGRTGPPSSAVR